MLTAEFTTRRDAETAVEYLVQQLNLDRNAIQIVAASDMNTAGTTAAGADLEGGRPKTQTEGDPALAGKVKVSVDIDEARTAKVVSAFEAHGGVTTS